MYLKSPSRWLPRLSAFTMAALVAASSVYWVLRWSEPQVTDAALLEMPLVTQTVPAVEQRLLARLLGDDKSAAMALAPSGMASRLLLSGIVASATGAGAALISVDGQPARAYAVGSTVTEGLMLQSVAPRHAMLAASAAGPVALTLELKRSAQ